MVIGFLSAEQLLWAVLGMVIVMGAIGITVIIQTHRRTTTHLVSVKSGDKLELELKKEFVTRREFEKHEVQVGAMVSEIKGTVQTGSSKMEMLYERTADAMEKRDRSLSDKIEKVADDAYHGRKGLHAKTNQNCEDIAALKAKGDVAEKIVQGVESLAEQIKGEEES